MLEFVREYGLTFWLYGWFITSAYLLSLILWRFPENPRLREMPRAHRRSVIAIFMLWMVVVSFFVWWVQLPLIVYHTLRCNSLHRKGVKPSGKWMQRCKYTWLF